MVVVVGGDCLLLPCDYLYRVIKMTLPIKKKNAVLEVLSHIDYLIKLCLEEYFIPFYVMRCSFSSQHVEVH